MLRIHDKSVIEQNGDYCETRLLNAGQWTNAWFQETSHNVIGENELVAFDTDVVGCHGHYSTFPGHFIPGRYYINRYYLSAHGCGMTGEYPYLYQHRDFPAAGYDGEIKPGMTLCVKSYIGEERGNYGVKLEQQVLIAEQGIECLSDFPFEENLLSHS